LHHVMIVTESLSCETGLFVLIALIMLKNIAL